MSLWLRSLAFNLVLFSTGITLGVVAQIARHFQSPEELLRIGQLWCRISLRALELCCNIKIGIQGREFLPPGGAALIAPQHQSAFDTLLWLTLLPQPAYVLKQELLKTPLLGSLSKAAGFIGVDRDGGATALRKMVADCREAVARGRQIVIFPEGTRVPAGERGILHPGVIALARALNLPVVPASTNSGLHWGKNAFKKYPGILTVKIHPAISHGSKGRDLLAELAAMYYGEPVDNSVD